MPTLSSLVFELALSQILWPHFWTNSTINHCHLHRIKRYLLFHVHARDLVPHLHRICKTQFSWEPSDERLKRKNIILSAHSDTEYWTSIFVSLQTVHKYVECVSCPQYLQKASQVPLLPYSFLDVMLVDSIRRNQVGYSYILIKIVALWDLIRLYPRLPKAHQHKKTISKPLFPGQPM